MLTHNDHIRNDLLLKNLLERVEKLEKIINKFPPVDNTSVENSDDETKKNVDVGNTSEQEIKEQLSKPKTKAKKKTEE